MYIKKRKEKFNINKKKVPKRNDSCDNLMEWIFLFSLHA